MLTSVVKVKQVEPLVSLEVVQSLEHGQRIKERLKRL